MPQCNECQCNLRLSWQTFKDGTKHIRSDCPKCGKMKGYLPKTIQNTEQADGQISLAEDMRCSILSGAISDSIILLTSSMDLDEAPDVIKKIAKRLISAARTTGKSPPSWCRSKYEQECWTK